MQHVPFEGPGVIGPWLRDAGLEISSTLLFEHATLPDPDGLDVLVVMGGPMSANDEDAHPWLVEEKAFIRAAIESGVSVLGICLGAQLVASAMGARVYANREKEIGWFPVRATATGDSGALRLPDAIEVFHWHGDTFDLPQGALRLASSDGCENQAFQFGRRVVGLQFHAEVTPTAVREMLAHGAAELTLSRYVQREADLLAVRAERYRAANDLMCGILEYLCSGR